MQNSYYVCPCKRGDLCVPERLQNRAARIIANETYDYSATSILKDLGWPSVKDIIFIETSIITLKAQKHDCSPSHLSGILQNLTQVHSRELRNRQPDLRVLLGISSNSQISFSYRGTRFGTSEIMIKKRPFPNSI